MRILLATDGSRGAGDAASLLARLSLTEADRIVVLGVSPLGADRVAAHQEAARATLAGCPAEVSVEARTGAPAEAILDCAGEVGAGLIALGAMGATGLVRFFMGSVAERVLRHATVPVLVARPVRAGLGAVVAAVDASDVSERVVEAAARFPLPAESAVRLVTVLPPRETIAAAAPVVWATSAADLEAVLEGAVNEARERLRELGRKLRESRPAVTAEVLRGDPASSIIASAQEQTADLVILGSHGEGGIDRWLLGSVSERVARHAPCSVLVVR